MYIRIHLYTYTLAHACLYVCIYVYIYMHTYTLFDLTIFCITIATTLWLFVIPHSGYFELILTA